MLWPLEDVFSCLFLGPVYNICLFSGGWEDEEKFRELGMLQEGRHQIKEFTLFLNDVAAYSLL